MKENILSLFRKTQESEEVEIIKYDEENLLVVHEERKKQNDDTRTESRTNQGANQRSGHALL